MTGGNARVTARKGSIGRTNATVVAVLVLAALAACLVAATFEAEPSAAALPGENGRIVFSSERDTPTNPEKDAEIFTMNPDGTKLAQLTQNSGIPDVDPVFSPDGSQIAFTQTLPTGIGQNATSKIFVMNANGTGKRQLTPDGEFAQHPAWSPDGAEIAYSEVGSISSGISARKAADRSGKRTIVDIPGQSRHPAFSPDGTEIVFENNRDGDFEIFTVASTGGPEARITTNSLNDLDPAYAPDGKRIAFSSPRNGTTESKREILVVDFAGGCCTLKQLTTNSVEDNEPAFSPDGTKIAFVSDRGGVGVNNEIITMDSRTGAGGTNITNTARADLSPDWQPGNATIFTVNSTGDLADADRGDALCDVNPSVAGRQCTLRAAIQQAGATGAADTINFDIPTSTFGVGGCSRSGVCTISPKSALPPIKDPTDINGYTQRGASPNTLAKGTNAVIKIELNGSGAGTASGLTISENSSVRGLAINRFSISGISVITVEGMTTIAGNFIGTDPSGTRDLGNGRAGVSVNGARGGAGIAVLTIGGGTFEDRNVISGNGGNGVEFDDTQDALVRGNLIGTEKDGRGALGNDGSGVAMFTRSFGVTVGGPTPSTANTIAFNGGDGVGVTASSSSSEDNDILRNSVFSNGGLGIDLDDDGPTPNDPGDGDFGPNGLQNKPVITSVTTIGSTTTGSGDLNSAPGTTFEIQFFSNPSDNEGKVFRGQTSVTTNAQGNAPFVFGFPVAIPAGQTVTATATDPDGNTSEFSAPRAVVAQ